MNNEWMLIAVIFFGLLSYVAWIRWIDQHWIEKHIGNNNVIAMSFGVGFFGRATEPGKPKRSGGFLLLMQDRLFFRSRRKNVEISIPGSAIVKIYPDSSHKGVDLHQSVMKIDFLSEQGEKDSVAFRVPYPPQWIQAIGNISENIKS